MLQTLTAIDRRDKGVDKKDGSCVTKKAVLQALRALDRRKTRVEEHENQRHTRPAFSALIAVDRRDKGVGEHDGSFTPRESVRRPALKALVAMDLKDKRVDKEGQGGGQEGGVMRNEVSSASGGESNIPKKNRGGEGRGSTPDEASTCGVDSGG